MQYIHRSLGKKVIVKTRLLVVPVSKKIIIK